MGETAARVLVTSYSGAREICPGGRRGFTGGGLWVIAAAAAVLVSYLSFVATAYCLVQDSCCRSWKIVLCVCRLQGPEVVTR